MVTKGVILLDVLSLFCTSLLLIEKIISVKISSVKDSSTEFVLYEPKASSFAKPLLTPRGCIGTFRSA